MTIQRIKITAKNPEELEMRVEDSKLRGYQVISTPEPVTREHKSYNYKQNKRGNNKVFSGAESSTKHIVIMERDYVK